MGGCITTRPQESQYQGHSSKVKGHRTKIPCTCTSTPHGQSTGTKIGHIDINTLDTAASTRFPWSRSLCQGQSQYQEHSSKVKGHRTNIPCPCTSTPHGQSTGTKWPQWHQYLGHRSVYKISKFKVIAPKSKVAEPKFHAHAHLHLMGGPHTQFGLGNLNTLATKFCQWTGGQTD